MSSSRGGTGFTTGWGDVGGAADGAGFREVAGSAAGRWGAVDGVGLGGAGASAAGGT